MPVRRGIPRLARDAARARMRYDPRMSSLPGLSALVAALALAACGGSSTPSGSDASTDATTDSTTGTISCNGTPCPSGQACVITTAGGGACQAPDDAGLCPDGKPGTPGQCCDNTTTTYACQPLPAACNGALACPCASSLCQCGGCDIADAGTLKCTCLYP